MHGRPKIESPSPVHASHPDRWPMHHVTSHQP